MTDERTRQPRETADTRAEFTQARRKNREVAGASADPTAARYGVTQDFFDHDKWSYYSALDKGTRLYDLTVRDDYDFVGADGKRVAGKDGVAEDGALRYRAGTVDGQAQYSYLLRKPKQFADEDRAKKIAKIDADEEARLRRTPGDAPDKSYTPKR